MWSQLSRKTQVVSVTLFSVGGVRLSGLYRKSILLIHVEPEHCPALQRYQFV